MEQRQTGEARELSGDRVFSGRAGSVQKYDPGLLHGPLWEGTAENLMQRLALFGHHKSQEDRQAERVAQE